MISNIVCLARAPRAHPPRHPPRSLRGTSPQALSQLASTQEKALGAIRTLCSAGAILLGRVAG